MTTKRHEVLLPAKLKPGDRVRLLSPASTPTPEGLEQCATLLASWGLHVEIAPHALDEYGYLAGTDKDRLADFNDALRDPDVKAIFATRGGKGAYRIADGLDFSAARKDPKLLVGFSEITILHLALWKQCRIASIHGGIVSWNVGSAQPEQIERLRSMIMTTDPVCVSQDTKEPTALLTTRGSASGFLMGGNQDMMAAAAGWALPDLRGAILLLEDVDKRLGHMDRQLTMLQNAGYLRGIAGIALGRYYLCGPDATTQGDWTALDVLRDRLRRLNVPILGGLPLGHGQNPEAVPLGTMAFLDADAGTLTVEAAVQ